MKVSDIQTPHRLDQENKTGFLSSYTHQTFPTLFTDGHDNICDPNSHCQHVVGTVLERGCASGTFWQERMHVCVASRWQKMCQLSLLQNTVDHSVGTQRPESVTPTPAPYLKALLKMNGSSVCCVAPGTSHGLENKHSELRRKEATSITSLPEPHGAATGCGEGNVQGPLAAGAAGAAFPQQVRATGGDGVSSGRGHVPALPGHVPPSVLCPQSQQPSLGSAPGQQCLSQCVCAAFSTEAA